MTPDEIKQGFSDLAEKLKSSDPERSEEVNKFFKLLEKATSTSGKHPAGDKKEVKEEDDCPEGEDCGDLLSPCCQVGLETVFGTMPLEVKCTNCEKTYVLRTLLGF